jgi:hypothetical protein
LFRGFCCRTGCQPAEICSEIIEQGSDEFLTITMYQDSTSVKFRFTATKPTPLLKDFETFTRYLEQNVFALGKATDYIPYKPLAALNEVMMHPNTENTSRTPQVYYPQLHLYYHLALAGKLFCKVYHKNQTFLEVTARLAAYRALSAAEKYFFLLETLWIDCAWQELGEPRSSVSTVFAVERFLQDFSACKPGLPITANDESTLLKGAVLFLSNNLIQCFSFFGWYELERDEDRYQELRSKDFYPIARLMPSTLGVILADILTDHRRLPEWNIPCLRIQGMLPTRRETKKKASPDFVGLFRSICASGELRSIMPRELLKRF